jgi:hypothetical protein
MEDEITMKNTSGEVLIMFPDIVSEVFITKLKMCDSYKSFVLCVPTRDDAERLLDKGFQSVYAINYTDRRKLIEMVGPFIQKIIIVETDFIECCRAIELIRSTYSLPVYVIKSDTRYVARVYKDLGADYVIYNKTGNIQFVLSS